LSTLSVWLLSLGIDVSFIEPGHPEQNGRHERMHLTLQLEVTQNPAGNLRQQQRAFDRFRHEYNWERPHEALANKTPGSVHKPSSRRWPTQACDPEYPNDSQLRSVRGTGQIKWNGGLVFVGEAFIGHCVALVQVDDGEHEVRFYNHVLGTLDERTQRIHPR
jgi:hypothetical protein